MKLCVSLGADRQDVSSEVSEHSEPKTECGGVCWGSALTDTNLGLDCWDHLYSLCCSWCQ